MPPSDQQTPEQPGLDFSGFLHEAEDPEVTEIPSEARSKSSKPKSDPFKDIRQPMQQTHSQNYQANLERSQQLLAAEKQCIMQQAAAVSCVCTSCGSFATHTAQKQDGFGPIQVNAADQNKAWQLHKQERIPATCYQAS